MNLEEKIQLAFRDRVKPNVLATSTSLFSNEVEEIEAFTSKYWFDISCDDDQIAWGVISHFSGEAFCYFLPGFMLAGIRSNTRNLLVFNHIIGELDRSPNIEYWDSHFVSRWPLLTFDEIIAVQEWLLWYAQSVHDPWGNTYDRCFDTLELLKNSVNQ